MQLVDLEKVDNGFLVAYVEKREQKEPGFKAAYEAEVMCNQLPPTEVGGLFLSSVVKRLKADSLPKDSILRPYTFYTVT